MKVIKFILKFLVKLICSPTIVILLFIEKVLLVFATVVTLVSKIIFIFGIVMGVYMVIEDGVKLSELWIAALISFIGFIMPYVVAIVPALLMIMRENLTNFVLGRKLV